MTVNVSKPVVNVREKLAELDKPTGIAGEAMLRAETPQEQQALIGVGRRNIIKNGAMQVWQRGTSFTSVSANDTFTADRFAYQEGSSTTAAYTISQSTGPVEYGFDRSFKIEVTTADTSLADNQYAQIHYPIEGQDLQQMAKGTSGALPVTMSFWVKSSVTGAYAATLWDGPNSRQNSAHYTVDAAGVWEHKVITYVGDTTGTIDNDNTEGLAIKFVLSAGVDYTGGTEGPSAHSGSGTSNYAAKQVANLVTATGNYWEITGVQLELGKVATPFEHRSYGEELALCQRYYQRYTESGSSNYGPTIGYGTFNGSAGATTTEVVSVFQFPVAMRTGPDFAFSNLTHFDLEPFDHTITALETFSHSSPFFHTVKAVSSTARETGFVGFICMDSANGWFEFDAEL